MGMHKIKAIDKKLVSPVGFSNGMAPLALKNPPPLVPSCLMVSWEATGPRGMICLTLFNRSWMCAGPLRVWIAPWAMNTMAKMKAIGRRM